MRVELACEIVMAQEAQPRRGAFFVHGMLGAGANLRSFAQKLVDAFPDWRIALPDLRAHGSSPAGTPPFTLRECAQDLVALARRLGWEPELVCGHSFGGKVALLYGQLAPRAPRRIWALDSPPGPRSRDRSDELEQSAADVIAALRKVTLPLRNRKDMIDQLLALGLTRPIALWMTTNLREAEGGYRWKFDLDAAEAMLQSYLEADLWPVVESPPAGARVDLVRAQRSGAWSESDLWHFDGLDRARMHLLPDSGHWVHVDNPQGLFDILAPSFA